ncbi:MAG TPA: hypothetical protein VHT53_02205 [Candidatus Elarobacter sp.]|nr:hypothetical protein [Candidatus Elarobacter sp.]
MSGTAGTVRRSRRAGARIAIAGVSATSAPLRALRRAELDDVTFVAEAAELRDADMLVFVAAESDAIDVARTAALAESARERGMLVAAIVAAASDARPSPLLAAMRDAADLVMVVREHEDIRAIVAALR